MSRRVRRVVGLVAVSIVFSWAFAVPAGAAALTKNSRGWYSPVASWSFGSMGGFGAWRSYNRTYHLAKDISAPVGRPVYALADGYVYDAYPRLAGYAPGGAMIVVYRTDDGRYFKALYGHVRKLRYRKGQRVRAGAVLAYIAPCGSRPHLHFGIHMGLGKPSDPRRNPFMGHGRVRGRTYGWVDPARFLAEAYAVGMTPPPPAPPPSDVTSPSVDPTVAPPPSEPCTSGETPTR